MGRFDLILLQGRKNSEEETEERSGRFRRGDQSNPPRRFLLVDLYMFGCCSRLLSSDHDALDPKLSAAKGIFFPFFFLPTYPSVSFSRTRSFPTSMTADERFSFSNEKTSNCAYFF